MCEFGSNRWRRVPITVVLLVAALAAGAAWAGSTHRGGSGKVAVIRAGVEPSLISPGVRDGIRDDAVLTATLVVRRVAGLRGAEASGENGDSKTYVVRWEWIITDLHGNEVNAIAGYQDLLAREPGIVPASYPMRRPWRMASRFDGAWDGTGSDGSVVPDGSYPYEVWAEIVRVDILGNGRRKEKLIDFLPVTDGVVVVDSTPPVISILGVPDCTASPVTPVVEVADAHPETVEMRLDGEAFTEGTTITEDGEHLLRVAATDLAGNEAISERTFVIDTTAPEVTVVGVEDGAEVEPGTVVTVYVEDPNLVSSETLLDGAPFESGSAVEEPGDHELTVTAEDCAVNTTNVSIDFRVAAQEQPVTGTLFVNADDPGLVRFTGGTFGSLDVAGTRTLEGLADTVDSMLVADPSGETFWVRFGDGGRLDRLDAPDGFRVEIEWLDAGQVQMTLRVAELPLQSAAVFGGSSAAQALIPSVPKTDRFRMELRRGDPDSFEVEMMESPILEGDPLQLSVQPVPPRPLASPAVSAIMASAACTGEVTASTCGVPLDDPRILVTVSGSGGAVEPYAVPAAPVAGDLHAYALACESVPMLEIGQYCGSVDSALSDACTSCAVLEAYDTAAACGQLASQLGRGGDPLPAGQRDAIADRCARMLALAAGACQVADLSCDGAGMPSMIDRRTVEPVSLETEVVSDAAGTGTAVAEADGTGPFPAFSFPEDDDVVVTHLQPEFVEGEFFEIIGRVACAPPGTTMTYAAELCDFDGAGCFPYNSTAEADGTGEIGFRFTGRYGFDQVSVTFSVEGGPSRKVVVTF